MNTVKHPNWDKVEKQQLLFTPGTPEDKLPLDHLEVGMMVEASVKSAVIKIRLSKILPPSSAEAEILRIGNNDETIDSLSIGDTVFIKLRDMKCRDVGESDINTT